MWRVRALELKRERVFEDWERKSRQPPLVRCEIIKLSCIQARGYTLDPSDLLLSLLVPGLMGSSVVIDTLTPVSMTP